MFNEIRWNKIITSVIFIVVGIILIIMPATTMKTICMIVGGTGLVCGIVTIIIYLTKGIEIRYHRNDLVMGLVEIFIGIFVMVRSDLIIALIPFLLGFFVMTSGFLKLQNALDIRKMGFAGWPTMIILAAINIIFGALLIFNPFRAAEILLILIGVGLVYSGISDLIITLYISKKVKDYTGRLSLVDVEGEKKD